MKDLSPSVNESLLQVHSEGNTNTWFEEQELVSCLKTSIEVLEAELKALKLDKCICMFVCVIRGEHKYMDLS